MLSQADFKLKLLPLRPGGDRHATPEDHVDFCHMLVSVRDLSVMFPSVEILGCRRYWGRYLFTIQKSFALFQIVSIGAMNLAPLLRVVRASERSTFLLIEVLFPAIAVSSMVLLISSFYGIDLPIVPSS
jgi:hypothetical protein